MHRRSILIMMLAAATGACTRHPLALADAPMPGMIGKPRYSTDDNSTTERVSFNTNATEAEVRNAFEQYCIERSMQPDPRPSGGDWITWYKSDHDFLGILISGPSVTYFYNQ